MSDRHKSGKKPFSKTRTFPILFMLVITLVFISVTSVIYTITRDTIRLNETLVLKRAVLYTAGIPVPESGEEVDQVYSSRIHEVTENDEILYYEITGLDSDQVESYVMIVNGPGLWGDIRVAVGYGGDLENLTGIEIIEQNETPGLGGRINEPWFKEQFRGKQPPLSTVPEGEGTTEEEFQAITGATYSTTGIRTIINDLSMEKREIIRNGRI